ncbi:hypothetical protein BH10CHL1_BH10CHL1_18500 [soil metagenome]
MKSVNSQALMEIPSTVVYHRSPSYPPIKQQDSPNNYTILIVEDDQPIRELIGLYLKTLGYHILLAENGFNALESINLYSVDLVLLDILLPRMDGLAVCTAIRKFSEIPIIMLTALNSLNYAASAFQLGADGYITKPFHLSTLKLRIQNLLHNHLTLV